MAGAVRPNTIVLLSMGYDSLSTWHQLGRPTAVYFDVGSQYTAPEVDRYQKLRSSFPQLLPVQDMRWLGEREQDEQETDKQFQNAACHGAKIAFKISAIIIANPAGAGSSPNSCR